ncbi:MAG: type III pantothenate kinase [Pseudomonadota bacterium]
MLLAIDVGNTNTVFALYKGAEPLVQWRASTLASRTADEHAAWLAQMLQFQSLGLDAIDDCVVSTVVPQMLFHLRNLARRYIGVEPVVVANSGAPGVPVRIDRPEQVGADRLVTAVGAYMKYGGPLIVVDSGTATTFDVVGADGGFDGGVIAPGINLSIQALHDAAAQLPRIAIEKPDAAIGRDTVSAMKSGVFWGYIGLIEGLIHRIKSEYANIEKVVATGGVASLFEGSTEAIDVFDPDLTVRGLYEIHRRVRSGAVG